MTRTLCVLTTAMMALLLAGPGSALHCNGDIITIDAGVETLYIDDRSDEAGDFDHWTYLEDNGIDGLQSGEDGACFCDPMPINLHDTCIHPDPDLLIL